MKHFGTDGIRALDSVFTKEYLEKISLGIATLGKNMTIIIGRDPRVSGKFIEDIMTYVFESHGVNVILAGMIPTPVLAFLTKKLNCNFGVMLSASHNPPEYNGIKLFSSEGEKVTQEVELAVEEFIENPYFVANGKGKVSTYDGGKDYIEHILSILKPNLSGMKVCLDTANGATSIIAPELFRRCEAIVTQYNNETDGININNGCGATIPKFLLEKMESGEYDIGFTYDGDGDRVMCIYKGKIYDGDHLMYVNCIDMKNRGVLSHNTMVGTIMSNLGTENACKKAGINFIRAGVGDKLVYREMKANGYNVGGEESGHIIFSDILGTGDGMIASFVTTILHLKTPIDTLDDIVVCPSVTDAIVCDKVGIERFRKSEEIAEYLANIIGYRTVIRPSGTEPKIRILVEHEDYKMAKDKAEEIKEFIKGRII